MNKLIKGGAASAVALGLVAGLSGSNREATPIQPLVWRVSLLGNMAAAVEHTPGPQIGSALEEQTPLDGAGVSGTAVTTAAEMAILDRATTESASQYDSLLRRQAAMTGALATTGQAARR